jgi:hypothetical protein
MAEVLETSDFLESLSAKRLTAKALQFARILGPMWVQNVCAAKGQTCEFSEERLEAPPGFEPGMEVLQTSALPLGDGAVRKPD